MRRGKIKAGDGGDHQPKKSRCWIPEQSYLSHKEILNAEQEIYIPQYPLSPRRGWQPGDSRERRDLSGVTHEIILFWQVGPTPQWWISMKSRSNPRYWSSSKPYELNQYNPYTTWNSVNAKPVFWYNQS
jgi:hypothetical protein